MKIINNSYIIYCMIGFNKLYEIEPYIENILKYVDEFIFVDGGDTGSSTDGTLEYLQSLNFTNKIKILHHKWNNNFSDARNEYLSEIQKMFLAKNYQDIWILTSDTDEHFPEETLSDIRNEIEAANMEEYDGIKIRSYDIIKDGNIEIKNELSNFYKPLLFKYNSNIYYKHSVHENIKKVLRWKKTNLVYYHTRTQKKIYERAIQNFFISDRDSEIHRKFINICTKNKLSEFKIFFEHYMKGILPLDIENWLYDNRHYKDESNELELLELRDTSNFYFNLHKHKDITIYTLNNINKKDILNKRINIPTISTYITTHNSIFYQSTLEQTIRQSLLFSDEIIIVNSEQSTDGTQNLLDKLKDEYPKIIKLYTFKEDYSKKWMTVTDKKSFALSKCTCDYAILQDDDECIHEKYADIIKQLPIDYPEAIAFKFNTIHFYRSFNHYKSEEDWYKKKIYMIRNLPEIKHGIVGKDLDNHVVLCDNKYIPLNKMPNTVSTSVISYHYGWCRNDAILLMKKYQQDKLWHEDDYWKTQEFPYKFDDPNNLPEFKETHPKYMIPIIKQEEQFNSKHVKEFTKEDK